MKWVRRILRLKSQEDTLETKQALDEVEHMVEKQEERLARISYINRESLFYRRQQERNS
jgi:hypothetical protein